MKKKYITPVVRDIEVETGLVCNSPTVNNEGTDADALAPVRLDIFNYGGLNNSGLGGE